ncbi:hypothetical protein SteCoe_3162 [Stentor coeruleus]|uniref:Uncharacterized protein n=1 Tax=Stentor coeruleus TaxID=5963 RepID=A0A1R2CXV0_9CILI|nr:hypothetical protein SteCoe_3162 [Stentor coeruleus]
MLITFYYEFYNMNYANYPKTTRANKKPNSEHMLSYSALTPRSNPTFYGSFASSSDTSEALKMRKEILQLQKNLKEANQELEKIKFNHENEVNGLRSAFEALKCEVQALREEKAENLVLQSYGIDDYGMLGHEVIRLRTEVDRLTFMYNKEKKKNLSITVGDEAEDNEEEPNAE